MEGVEWRIDHGKGLTSRFMKGGTMTQISQNLKGDEAHNDNLSARMRP